MSVVSERKKVMPVLGCMERRKYREAREKGARVELDPCIMCDERTTCMKSVVLFYE